MKLSGWNKLGLPRSGKKFWKMIFFPGQGIVTEFYFQSGKFRKKLKKCQGILHFSKKDANLCSETFLSNIYGLRFFFKD